VVEADVITSAATITNAGSVALEAVSDRGAMLTVSQSITATGAVELSAQSGTAIALSAFGPYTSTSTANVSVQGAGTVVSGATVAITALNAVAITATVNSASMGSTTINQTNTTTASVSGGARVTTTGAGSPVIAGSDGARVLISAVDNSTIDVAIGSTAVGGYDFNLLKADTTLDRSTSATVSDKPAAGSTLSSAGLIRVDARNDGGVGTRTTAGLAGVSSNSITESVEASVTGATVGSAAAKVGGLAVRATNAAAHEASGKLASNSVSGDTTAAISASVVHVTAQGVQVAATQETSVSAASTESSIDFGPLDGLTSDISVGLAVARNAVSGDVAAQIDGESQVVVTGGDLSVSAERAVDVTAVGEATSVSTQGALPGSVTVSLGGLLVENPPARSGPGGHRRQHGEDLHERQHRCRGQ